MARIPAVWGLVAGFVLLAGGVTPVHAQPRPDEMLNPKLGPKMDDVIISTPSPEELKNCTVKLINGTAPNSNGWLLVDANGKPLRRYFDSTGHKGVDVWSYYKDGVEVYREFDTTLKSGRPNNFRWLNGGGTKWGVGGVDPKTGKGFVEYWRAISAEEVGFEAFQAISRQDFNRLKLLFISDAEMQALKMSPATMSQISATQQGAFKKFSEISRRVKLAGARFDRVEGSLPGSFPENGPAGEVMVIKYASRAIQYEQAKKVEWLHTGEMIQAGMAWRLVDVPSDIDPLAGTASKDADPLLTSILNELTELDRTMPNPVGKKKEYEAYLTKRIGLVQKIVPLNKADQQEMWYKQLFDNLSSLAQSSGDAAMVAQLKQWKNSVASKMPGSNLAAYATYREMSTEYAIEMVGAPVKKIPAIQERWVDQLSGFVKMYPRAEDTPEALIGLAIGCEFAGKDEEAKRWYTQLSENFPAHALAPRARGSVARLNLPGRNLELTAPMLLDPSKTFNIAQLKGKVVIVHYWASDSTNFADDFVRLKRVMDQSGQKVGVELVCINLDDRAETARESLKKAPGPWIHLYQAPSNNSGGGLNSPLAVQYGIHMLPTTFMVGRDGRVTNRSLQIGDIEMELKKVQ